MSAIREALVEYVMTQVFGLIVTNVEVGFIISVYLAKTVYPKAFDVKTALRRLFSYCVRVLTTLLSLFTLWQ